MSDLNKTETLIHRGGLLVLAAVIAFSTTASARAALIANLRFEDGAPGTLVFDNPGTVDSSGNGNNFAAFAAGTSPAFSNAQPAPSIPNSAASNNVWLDNTAGPGGGFLTRDAFSPGGGSPDLNAHVFTNFTVEASVKLNGLGGFQTFVGKDRTDGQAVADLYFQKPGDASGFSIRAKQADGTFVVVNGATPVVANRWYNVAAVADGANLDLYVQEPGEAYVLDGTMPFAGGLKPGGAVWTIGRGQFNGSPGDQAFGFIDEVRIDDAALAPSQFQFVNNTAPGTLAYWRFEDGPAFAPVPHTPPDGWPNYSPDVPDASGNGNELSMWSTGGGPGFAFRSDVPGPSVPQTGEANNFSIKNTGGFPASFTEPGSLLSTMSLSEWTVEASWKPENGGFRTVLGRDAQGVATSNAGFAALYLQAVPGDALAIKFTDEAGFFHEAISAPGLVQGFDFGSDPEGLNGVWHNIAATSDGETLSLYLDLGTGYELVAQTDLTLSGSTNTALTNGFNVNGGVANGGDWGAGQWSVGRGLFGGGHVDRAFGFIDEVRISNVALNTREFLFASVPEPATLALVGLGGMALLFRRRRER